VNMEDGMNPWAQKTAHESGEHLALPATAGPYLGQARQVLKQTFGYAEFHPLQGEVIGRVLSQKRTLVIMPTGGGKSLCYQLPALMLEGLTLVVSPLISLMRDQVAQLRELGIPAACLNSTLSPSDVVAVTRDVLRGTLKILYAAPETVLRPDTLPLLDRARLSCLAVDEAHCISEWGHDFRPEYRQLEGISHRFGSAACLALTATATPRVRQDIRRLLDIEAEGEFVASFNRPNLRLAAQPRSDGLDQTLEFLQQHRGQSGIIYCSTRQQVNELTASLRAKGWPALSYHAGLDDALRRQNQDQFIGDDAGLMVATVAFGMGINKSNVRFVLHYTLPKDLESYYQEIGRAGRDGLPADCLLLHSRADAIVIRRFIEGGASAEQTGRQGRLEAMIQYAETVACRRRRLLAYFGESTEAACGYCDLCLPPDESSSLQEVTLAAQKFLSCVKRSGELFGPSHIIDILRGSRSQKVLARGHDQLSTHGIGQEYSMSAWRHLARQFIRQGLVEQDLEHGGLRLTTKAYPVFKGQKVFASLQREKTVLRPADDLPKTPDAVLFERLRAVRRQLAADAGVPSYVIFSDRTLMDMAGRCPHNDLEFLAINGVGEVKLAHYGEAFLSVIREHCASRSRASR
jgi:ATP-dependent DNA helicase RecQ